MKMMSITDIATAEPFRSLFTVRPDVLRTIVGDMRVTGYDACQPIILWQGRDLVVDGHTRLLAAQEAGIGEIPVVERGFGTEDEAVEYAVGCQRKRRNLTDAEIARCVRELDRRRRPGEKQPREKGRYLPLGARAPGGCSAARTAELIGTSPTKVKKARTVMDRGSADVKAGVDNGELSLNRAYRLTTKGGPGEDTPVKRAVNALYRAFRDHGAETSPLDLEALKSFCRSLIDDVDRELAGRRRRERNADNGGQPGWLPESSSSTVSEGD